MPTYREYMRMTQINSNKIIYPELSYKIVGLCFQVQRELGRFCRERQFCDALENKLKGSDIAYAREKIIDTEELKGNRADFIINDKILLEVKAIPYVTKKDYFQVQRYLRATNLKLALIVNFQSKYLKPKRIINNQI